MCRGCACAPFIAALLIVAAAVPMALVPSQEVRAVGRLSTDPFLVDSFPAKLTDDSSARMPGPRGGAANGSVQAGAVAYTLVLLNNTRMAGNFLSANGLGPWAVGYDSWNGYLYVSNIFSNSISVIDSATNRIVAWIPVREIPYVVVFDRTNGELYVTNYNSDNISVIDGATNQVVASIPIGAVPSDIAFDSANGDLYVSTGYNVTVIDGATNKVVATIPLASGAGAIAFDSANGDLYVSTGYN